MSRNPDLDTGRAAVARRVREVADLTGRGLSARTIASRLRVTTRSVVRYRARARRLGLLASVAGRQ